MLVSIVRSDEDCEIRREGDERHGIGLGRRRRITLITSSLKPPADRDNYGGLAGSAEKNGLEAKGYFAIQQLDDRKVMTTPDGDLYFSLAGKRRHGPTKRIRR